MRPVERDEEGRVEPKVRGGEPRGLGKELRGIGESNTE